MTIECVKPGRTGVRPLRQRVLIVEDNDLNMKLFNDLLVAHGYDTLQTKDGVEALALARQHRPDLILMDIQLPEVSGLEVTKWIKEDESLSMIPIIAVTAFAMKETGKRCATVAAKITLPSRFQWLAFCKLSNAFFPESATYFHP
jgi:two-component system cell cycle response regulator DivK